MPIDFPNSPTNGDTYSAGGKNWQYNGSAWVLQGVVPAIPNGSITETQIANSAITSAKIAAGAVVEADIADGAVTTAKIAAGAVVEADIASNAVTAGKLGTDVQLGYRNVVINGAMQVAQRGTSTASITTTGYRTVDRFSTGIALLGTWTESVENDAPTGSGFRKSVKLLCTTADASPAAGDYALYYQVIEGQNLQHFLKGTASAKQWTLSFWVKGTTTGTYIVELYDNANTRSVSAAYTINAADTWEKKTITFPADTTGAAPNTNAAGVSVQWWLGAGTTFTSGTLATTWVSTTSANRAVGQTNLAGATNRSWQITGVQLEAGSVATPFEFEDYGTTLAKCQRYYQTSYQTGVTPGSSTIVSNALHAGWAASASGAIAGITYTTPVTMRAEPTQTLYDLAGNSARYTGVAADGTQTNNQAFNSVGSHQSGGYGRLYGVAYSGMIFQWVHSAEL